MMTIIIIIKLLLPPPRRTCNRRCLSVCLFVSNFAQKKTERICVKFLETFGNGPMKKWLNFGRIWIRIRIATLVRRALAEVCTVPVLLVINGITAHYRQVNSKYSPLSLWPPYVIGGPLYLWPPYVIGGYYIFALWFLSIFLLLFFLA